MKNLRFLMFLFVNLLICISLFSQKQIDSVAMNSAKNNLLDSSISSKGKLSTGSAYSKPKKIIRTTTKNGKKTSQDSTVLNSTKKSLPTSRCPCKVLIVSGRAIYDGKILREGHTISGTRPIMLSSDASFVIISDSLNNNYFISKTNVQSMRMNGHLQMKKQRPKTEKDGN